MEILSFRKFRILLSLLIIVLFASPFFIHSADSYPGGKSNDNYNIISRIKSNIDTGAPGKVNPDTLVKGNFHPASGIYFDSNAISKFLAAKPAFNIYSNDFRAFYREKKFSFVWYDKNGLIEPTHLLISAINNQSEEGLFAKVPYSEEFLELVNHIDSKKSSESSAPDVNTELMLTAQYFNYAKNLWTGAAGDKISGWYLPKKKLSFAALLEQNLETPYLAESGKSPVIPQYTGLKKALAHYRDIEKKSPETLIPLLKKPAILKVNDTSNSVLLVRGKLYRLGLLEENDGSILFDAGLGKAIDMFRQTHGLNAGQQINNELIKELNIPVKKRIEQIMVNMERFRWIPLVPKSDEFILVNIPEFRLHYYEKDEDVWSCNVVVGKPMTKTVIFSGDMKFVVFSPYWYVPQSIIRKEILPGIKKNPNYLEAHNMEWNDGKVRQRPGPANSLGLVKFLFPNANNIYLHDSPAKSLFNEESRAFSHGCIRVAKPRDLAIRILQQDSSWTDERIDAAMHAGTERFVTLKKKIPVYIGYFTTFIDKNGQLNFRKDVYSRDQALLAILMQ